MAQRTKSQLEYIINHVFLPPKLPQSAEPSEFSASAEKALLNLALSQTQQFQQRCAPEFRTTWLAIQKMLSLWSESKDHGSIDKKLITKIFLNMKPGGRPSMQKNSDLLAHFSSDTLPIEVRAQNAGLIFRCTDNAISLECFEMSPQSGDVIMCHGSLRRHFPAHAVAVPLEVATDPKFCEELCAFLEKLDGETVDDMMPKTRKAGSQWAEIRDTCHPGLITELLMVTLAAVGKPLKVFRCQNA